MHREGPFKFFDYRGFSRKHDSTIVFVETEDDPPDMEFFKRFISSIMIPEDE